MHVCRSDLGLICKKVMVERSGGEAPQLSRGVWGAARPPKGGSPFNRGGGFGERARDERASEGASEGRARGERGASEGRARDERGTSERGASERGTSERGSSEGTHTECFRVKNWAPDRLRTCFRHQIELKRCD